MKNIVLFGPPGSGKGTQAANIVSKYQLIHLSTGDLLRAEISAQTALGIEAKAIMDRGQLVPDAVVIGIIEHKLDANRDAEGFIFDGFPRTVRQAEALDALLASKNAPIQKVLSLKVSEEELTRRILDRGKTSGRSDDQDPAIVKNRVEEYRNKTEPLVSYYARQGKLVEVPGEGTVGHITDLLEYEIDGIADQKAAAPVPADKVPFPFADTNITKEKALPPAPPATQDKVPFPSAKKEAPPKKQAPKKAAAPPKKKAVAKKALKKATPKNTVKKAAKGTLIKNVAAKKPVKKVAPKKTVKKSATKKVAKKVAKKAPIKKVAAKKTVKKAAPKKAAKKAAKKVAKKVVSKKPVKRAAAKKAIKKAPAKKVAKKAVKKAAPKKSSQKGPFNKERNK